MPYCADQDLKNLLYQAAAIYQDMSTLESQRNTLKNIQVMRKRCLALSQWFETVIKMFMPLMTQYSVVSSQYDQKKDALNCERVRLLTNIIKEMYDDDDDDEDDDDYENEERPERTKLEAKSIIEVPTLHKDHVSSSKLENNSKPVESLSSQNLISPMPVVHVSSKKTAADDDQIKRCLPGSSSKEEILISNSSRKASINEINRKSSSLLVINNSPRVNNINNDNSMQRRSSKENNLESVSKEQVKNKYSDTNQKLSSDSLATSSRNSMKIATRSTHSIDKGGGNFKEVVLSSSNSSSSSSKDNVRHLNLKHKIIVKTSSVEKNKEHNNKSSENTSPILESICLADSYGVDFVDLKSGRRVSSGGNNLNDVKSKIENQHQIKANHSTTEPLILNKKKPNLDQMEEDAKSADANVKNKNDLLIRDQLRSKYGSKN